VQIIFDLKCGVEEHVIRTIVPVKNVKVHLYILSGSHDRFTSAFEWKMVIIFLPGSKVKFPIEQFWDSVWDKVKSSSINEEVVVDSCSTKSSDTFVSVLFSSLIVINKNGSASFRSIKWRVFKSMKSQSRQISSLSKSLMRMSNDIPCLVSRPQSQFVLRERKKVGILLGWQNHLNSIWSFRNYKKITRDKI